MGSDVLNQTNPILHYMLVGHWCIDFLFGCMTGKSRIHASMCLVTALPWNVYLFNNVIYSFTPSCFVFQVYATRTIGSTQFGQWLRKEYRSKYFGSITFWPLLNSVILMLFVFMLARVSSVTLIRYSEGEIRFNLMAIVSDRKMIYERKIAELQIQLAEVL